MAGHEYQLQRNARLESNNWVNLGLPITATNAVVNTSVPFGTNRRRFYRVVLFPQPVCP